MKDERKCETCGTKTKEYTHQLYCPKCNKWSLNTGTEKDYTITEYKNVTLVEPKPESNGDEIREAFEKENFHIPFELRIYKDGNGILDENQLLEILFISYKTAQQSSQAEIEKLKKQKAWRIGEISRQIRVNNNYQSRIKELEQQIENKDKCVKMMSMGNDDYNKKMYKKYFTP